MLQFYKFNDPNKDYKTEEPKNEGELVDNGKTH